MRQRLYTILFLLISLFYVTKPVLPYIEYIVSNDFIVKELCINKDIPNNCCKGKCYLEKQINKNSESDDSNQKKQNKQQKEDLKVFVLNTRHKPEPFYLESKFYSIDTESSPNNYSGNIYIPPKTLTFKS